MPKVFLSIEGLHAFRKSNVVTQFDEQGQYDTMKCTECGIEGRCRDLQTVEIERSSKRANYCKLSDAQIKKLEASAKYNQGIKSKRKCPVCKAPLSEIAVYEEEGTKIYWAEMLCKCGHKEMIDVTKRVNKSARRIPKRFRQLMKANRIKDKKR